MSNPVTPFNNWLISKIVAYLVTKEGCNSEEPEYTKDGVKAVVRDSFGYRYELHGKTLRRIDSDPKEFSTNVNLTAQEIIDRIIFRRDRE